MNIDKSKIKYRTELDIGLLNETAKGKRIIRRVKDAMGEDDVWLISAWGLKFSLRQLVDYLFKNGLDVFHIEYGSITRIYVCLIDSYRIDNSVVFSLKNGA
jgi:hypothetical protein